MAHETEIYLELDGLVPAATYEKVNARLARDGIRTWPLDLSGVPADFLRLLDQEILTMPKILAFPNRSY